MTSLQIDQLMLIDPLFMDVESVDSSSFDRVSRIQAKDSTSHSTHLILDVNTAIYPIKEGDHLKVVLAQDVELTAPAGDFQDDGMYDPMMRRRKTLLDSYEYAMYGRVYKFEEDPKDPKVTVFASFGGLLMTLKGFPTLLQKLTVDQTLYILISQQ